MDRSKSKTPGPPSPSMLKEVCADPWHACATARFLAIHLATVFAASLSSLVWLLHTYGSASHDVSSLQALTMQTSLMYASAGVSGGVLYCLRTFIDFAIRSALVAKRYCIWYLMRPFLSGGLAVMGVLLFRSDILIITVKSSLLPQIGLAFLIGYGFGKLIRKLEDTILSLFGDDRPSNSSSSPGSSSGPNTGPR